MRRALLLMAFVVAACSGSSGSTSTGGSTSGSGSSGSSGAVPSCPLAQRWDGTACAPSKEAFIDLYEYDARLLDGGTDPNYLSDVGSSMWRYVDAGPLATALRAPDDGGCATKILWYADSGLGGPFQEAEQFAGDWGQLSVSGTALGTLDLDVDGGLGTISSSAVGQTLINGGETLTFTASGGADFPAMSATLQAPTPLALTAPALVRGQPYNVTWTGTSPDLIYIEVRAFVPGGTWMLDCRQPDNGSYTIDASLTSQIPADPTRGYVAMMRVQSTTILPPTPFVKVGADVVWDAQSAVEVR